MRYLAAFLFLPLLLVTPLGADDWPHWRGPSQSGVSNATGLPTRWSEQDNIAWKATIRGAGVSSPIATEDLVIVTSQVGSGAVRQGPRLGQGGEGSGERPLAGAETAKTVVFLVTAFDRASGQQAWEREIPAEGPLPAVHDKHNLASPSPTTDGRHVYAWFATGQLVALDLRGRVVWQKHLGKEYGPFEINWGHGSSPAVHDGRVVLLCYHEQSSYLLALDAATGQVAWRVEAPRGVTSYSTPLVFAHGGRSEIVVNSSAGVSGHDAATGRRLWHYDESNRFPVPMPLYQDGVIYLSRGYRSSPFMAIRPGGTGDISSSHVLWRAPSGAPYISSLLYDEGLIYMMGDVGVLSVTDAKNGERVFQERIGGVYTASPVAADGKVYLLSEDGETIVVSAGRSPKVLARNRLDARQLASPAIAGGRLFIRADQTLYAIGASPR